MGLGCDSMVELELIDCDGNLLVVNAENHADLFWACRGAGGGNFGVVVSMTFALPEKSDQICSVEFKCADADIEKQAQFLLLWQRWLSDADERITMIAKIYRSSKEDYAISGKAFFLRHCAGSRNGSPSVSRNKRTYPAYCPNDIS